MKPTEYDRHKFRQSYEPVVQQTRVLTKRIAGTTITKIAKSEGASRPTMKRPFGRSDAASKRLLDAIREGSPPLRQSLAELLAGKTRHSEFTQGIRLERRNQTGQQPVGIFWLNTSCGQLHS
jgi:hypothetical protein